METGEVFLSEKDGVQFIRVKGNASFVCAPPLRELAKKLAAEPFSGLQIDLEVEQSYLLRYSRHHRGGGCRRRRAA